MPIWNPNSPDADTLEGVLTAGNATGGNDLIVSDGDRIRGEADLILDPGSDPGDAVVIDGDRWPEDAGSAGDVLTTDGAGSLSWAAGPGADGLPSTLAVDATTGANSITVNTGQAINGQTNLTLSPGAGGSDHLILDGLNWPTADGAATTFLKTDGAGTLSFVSVPAATLANVLLAGNSTGATSITVATGQAINGEANLTLSPGAGGSDHLILDGLNWPTADGAATTFLKTDGAGTLSFAAVAAPTLAAVLTAGNTTGTSNLIVKDGQTLRSDDVSGGAAGQLSARGGNASGAGNNAGGALTLTGGASTGTASGGSATLRGGGGGAGTGGSGGTAALAGGDGGGTDGPGGVITVTGGTATGTGEGGDVTITGGTGGTTGDGGDITLQGGGGGSSGTIGGSVTGRGGTATSGASGGTMAMLGGIGQGAGAGGSSSFQGGTGGATGAGGAVTLSGGPSGATSGTGGLCTVRGGDAATDGNGGNLTVRAGNAVAGNNTGGTITITAGNSQGSGAGTSITLQPGTVSSGARGRVLVTTAGPDTDRVLELSSTGSNGAAIQQFVGTRDPETLITANTGDLYCRDNSSLGELYCKTTGSAATGWQRLGNVSVIDRVSTNLTVTATVTETTIYSFSVPANALGANGLLHVVCGGTFVTSAAIATYTLRIKFGGTTIYEDASPSVALSAVLRAFSYDLWLTNRASVSAQIGWGTVGLSVPTTATIGTGSLTTVAAGGGPIVMLAGTVDTTSAATFSITVQHSTAAAGTTTVRSAAAGSICRFA